MKFSKFFSVAAVAALVVFGVLSIPAARADDSEGALIDAGSIVTSTDGGREAVAPLRGWSVTWIMSTRCEGAQSTRYVLCATSACAADVNSQLLDYDVTMDIPVNRSGSTKTYIALRTDDGGIPYCLVHVNR